MFEDRTDLLFTVKLKGWVLAVIMADFGNFA